MPQHCKTCGMPILSAIEKEYNTCTSCFRKDRMEIATKIVQTVSTKHPAKTKTPSSIRPITQACILDQNSDSGRNLDTIEYTTPDDLSSPDLNSDRAKSILVSFRISPFLENKLNLRLQQTNISKTEFLRALLEDSLA